MVIPTECVAIIDQKVSTILFFYDYFENMHV